MNYTAVTGTDVHNKAAHRSSVQRVMNNAAEYMPEALAILHLLGADMLAIVLTSANIVVRNSDVGTYSDQRITWHLTVPTVLLVTAPSMQRCV